MFNLRCKVSHLNGVQTKLKCKPNVKRCKRFVFPVRSHLFHHNALKTKAITFFQADHILTRFVFPPLYYRFTCCLLIEKFLSSNSKVAFVRLQTTNASFNYKNASSVFINEACIYKNRACIFSLQ